MSLLATRNFLASDKSSQDYTKKKNGNTAVIVHTLRRMFPLEWKEGIRGQNCDEDREL